MVDASSNLLMTVYSRCLLNTSEEPDLQRGMGEQSACIRYNQLRPESLQELRSCLWYKEHPQELGAGYRFIHNLCITSCPWWNTDLFVLCSTRDFFEQMRKIGISRGHCTLLNTAAPHRNCLVAEFQAWPLPLFTFFFLLYLLFTFNFTFII